MEVEPVFHMKGGRGESSYANNSSLQVSDTWFVIYNLFVK